MKRLKYIAFTVLLASFSLQSCDLERYPLTDLSEDNFGLMIRMPNWL